MLSDSQRHCQVLAPQIFGARDSDNSIAASPTTNEANLLLKNQSFITHHKRSKT